jgi:integrase/recombinase XerD
MPKVYLHYLGNESNESMLEAYGLKPKAQEIDKMKPRQCPNCSELNKIDSKFCVKCRMVLSYDAYTETVEDSNKARDEMQQLKDQINKMESTVSSVFSKMEGITQLTGIDFLDRKVHEKYARDPDKIK